MKPANSEQKDAIMKSLAIAGFVSVVIVIAFLVVKIVSFLPSAFTSLASLADGVYSTDTNPIVVVADENIINAGDRVRIQWSSSAKSGSYVFHYDCTDGVAVSLTVADGTRVVSCDTNYDLGEATEAWLTIESEKNRFTDLTYHIGFMPDQMDEVLVSKEDVVTVINASISTLPTVVTDVTDTSDSGDTETDTPATDEADDETDSEVSTPTPTPQPEPETEYVYEIPQSNPYGHTDLAVRFLAVGSLTSGNQFLPSVQIDNDSKGAIQFEVKNLGSKTSEDWTFRATLPNGMTFQSQEQAPLRPNERSVITLGFDLNSVTGSRPFNVSVATAADTFTLNNQFAWSVMVTD